AATDNPGVEFPGDVVAALAEGRTDIADAMSLWADAPKATMDLLKEEAKALADRWNRDLVRAMLAGNEELVRDTQAKLDALEQMTAEFIDPATAAREAIRRRIAAAVDAGALNELEARLARVSLTAGTGGFPAMQEALDKLLAFEQAAAEMPA